MKKRFLMSSSGVTITELMVAVAIIGIGILGLLKTFVGVHQAIQNSKNGTLANTLAQEKMQILKQKPYLSLLVTQTFNTRTDVTPNITYDMVNYPAESILEGGVQFTRYTYIQNITDNSGSLQIVAPDSQDTGMKQITVSVVWNYQGGTKALQINSVANNPNTIMGRCVLQGVVRNRNTLTTLPNAAVTIAENVGWRDTADSAGNYKITLSPGNFNVAASASGYFSALIPVSISPNQTQTIHLDLSPMSSGTIHGYAWMQTHLVISQVVAATGPANAFEYIELYNPTTGPIQANAYGANSPWIYYYDRFGNATYSYFNFVNTTIPANGYWLIANTATITINGISRTADAVYNGSGSSDYRAPNHLLQTSQPGGITLFVYPNNWSVPIDKVGWNKNPGLQAPAQAVEGSAIPNPGTSLGIQPGEQFVRKTDTSTCNASYGPAYDSDNNANDFMDLTSNLITPNNSTSGTKIAITGVPAVGAIISVTDGLSTHATVYATGSPQVGEFYVSQIATGTWDVYLTSSSFYASITSVAITANAVTQVPNTTTSPSWPAVNSPNTVISSSATNGYVQGRVTDVAGNVITGPLISVSAGGVTTPTNSDGRYFIQVPPGTYNMTANPSNGNSSYVSFTSSNVAISLGQVTSMNNIALSQGGRISGFVTRDGINALPGVIFVAQDANSVTQDQQVSDASGRFTLINLGTGTYTVQASLDTGETSSPTVVSVNVTAGATVSAGTFTITGDMGTITGAVTASGNSIRTGVVIFASTSTFAGSPPVLSSSTLSSGGYYLTSSQEDGTYSLDVRGSTSTTYNVYGYYPSLSGQTITMSTRTVSGVSINPGITTSGVNLSW